MAFAGMTCRTVSSSSRHDNQMVAASYTTFVIVAYIVYIVLSDGLSSLLTLSAGLQALAFLLLCLKVKGQTSVSGISATMLAMYAVTLVLRLSSTLWLNGYLPADSTGDWMFQCVEITSLCLALWLLQWVVHVRRVTMEGAVQEETQDNMPGVPYVFLGCAVLAILFHADLNHNKIFDIVWAYACYLETAAMLPQLWMMAQAGGEVEALTSHFIALTTIARFFSLFFWFLAFNDGIGIFGNYSEMMIIAAHLVQLALSCDFLALYVKSFGQRVPLGEVSSQWI
jgi:hypothetical protein